MQKIELSPNPVVLSMPVRYRSKKGRFTKPHLAAYFEFKPNRARKWRRIDLPKGRKSRAKVEELVRIAVYAYAAKREAAVIKREERLREKLPEAPRGEAPDFVRLKYKRRVTELFSKKLQEEILMVGHNFVFNKKVAITPATYDEVMPVLEEMIKVIAVDVFNKEKAWGDYFYLKIFGEGLYKRRVRKVDGELKVVPDVLGYSIDRAAVRDADDVLSHISMLFEGMRERFFGRFGRGGYFSNRVDMNEYFFTGFRIENIIAKKG